jgi:hypothetical protein
MAWLPAQTDEIPLAGLLLLWLATAATASHDPRNFYSEGSSEEQATAGARSSMAAHEQQHNLDCVEESIGTEWNWSTSSGRPTSPGGAATRRLGVRRRGRVQRGGCPCQAPVAQAR